MKKIIIASFTIISLALVANVHAVDLDWDGNRCVTIDNSFKTCKPSGKWDTQKTGNSRKPVMWEYHRKDVNPIISLNYDWDAKGKTAHDYAKVIKSRLSEKGVTFSKTKNTVINGRNVSIIEARNPAKDLQYKIGVWRNQAKGFYMICSANPGQYHDFTGDFETAIRSVEIVNEKR